MRTCPTCHGEVLIDGKAPTQITEEQLDERWERLVGALNRTVERERALRDALRDVLRRHGHSNADTDCPPCARAASALATVAFTVEAHPDVLSALAKAVEEEEARAALAAAPKGDGS